MLEEIIDNIEASIEDIKSIEDAPVDEQNEVLMKLREVSDTLNDWAEKGIGDEEDNDEEEY